MRPSYLLVVLMIGVVLGPSPAAAGQTVAPPTIHRVTVQADAGVLTITGAGLGPDLAVAVEGQPVTVLAGATATRMEVMAPAALLTTAGTYRLTVMDAERRGGDGFVVASPAAPVAAGSVAFTNTPAAGPAPISDPAGPSGAGAVERGVRRPLNRPSPAVTETPCVTAIGVAALSSNTSGCFNTASGRSALRFNTSGSYNTATGDQALTSNTTGSENSATGMTALFGNTTGSSNTATGIAALGSNTTGNYNTAIGSGALYANTTGDANTANGRLALYNNSTGFANAAIGFASLEANTTGANNAASGAWALASNTTGSNNTANGHSALFANTTGIYNVATGILALSASTTGNSNTASGAGALQFNTTGGINTAAGAQSLWLNTTGMRNMASGGVALAANTTGNDNTASGAYALQSNTTGNANAALGYNAGANATTGSYNVYLGANVVGTAADTNTLRIGLPYSGGEGQNRTFIAGVHGTQLTGPAVQVFIDANGQLGTLTAPVVSGGVTQPLAMERQIQAQQSTIADLQARLARLEALLKVGGGSR
jgi:hypothetical protein